VYHEAQLVHPAQQAYVPCIGATSVPIDAGADPRGCLQLTLLGLPQASLNGTRLRFTRRSALAALVYLALTRRAATRDHLAALLADTQAKGQALLRNSLIELRGRLGAYLRLVGQTVELDSALVVQSDLALLEAALRTEGEGRLAALQAAVEQYRGEFLEGLSLREAYAFEEWQYFERERLHSLLVRALDELCAVCWRRGQLDEALAYARRLISVEPWHEGAHRTTMLLLLQRGQRAEALGQYAVCREVLAAELAAAPAPETEALYQRIAAAPAPHGLPPEPTPFLGRAAELETLTQWLDEPGCRVVAITGMGGIGKTRLALRAAGRYVGGEPSMRWLRFPHGAHLVALDALPPDRHQPAAQSAERIFGAIAAALELPTPHRAGTILAALRDRRLLLLLDNVEHLAGIARVIDQIRAAAPAVSLLVTSRGSLPAAQHSLELGPLALPASFADLERAEASALFLQHARQAQLSFAPDAAERAAIAQICAYANGLPLAIMLAAQLVRAMPCAAIAELLRERPLELGSRLRNLPPRHQGLRANVAYAWGLLGPTQQLEVRRCVELGVERASADLFTALASVGLLVRDADDTPGIPDLLRALLAS
jgi:DNA-binding SARP family transcriptional activator